MIEPDQTTPGERDECAALWCMRIADARLDAGQQAEFDRWLAADPGNARAFEEAVIIWQGVDTIGDAPEMIRYRAEAVESLRELNARRWSRGTERRWHWPAAVAACFALIALATMLLLQGGTTHYRTGIGERRVVLLEDGSRLTLDASTHVDVRFEDEYRRLELVAGRAKFDVAHDPLRPFSVRAHDHVTVATGTSFSVELLSSEVRVVLYEGRVEVVDGPEEAMPLASSSSPNSQPVPKSVDPALALSPGKELIASTVSSASRVIDADLTRSLSWESGLLSFEGEPLAVAAERINRYAKKRILVRDKRVASYGISGVFAAGDVEAFVEGVTALHPVGVAHEQDKLVLVSAR